MNAPMEDLVEVEGVEEVGVDEAADVMISVPTFTDGVKAKQKQGEQRPHPSLLSLDQSYYSFQFQPRSNLDSIQELIV